LHESEQFPDEIRIVEAGKVLYREFSERSIFQEETPVNIELVDDKIVITHPETVPTHAKRIIRIETNEN